MKAGKKDDVKGGVLRRRDPVFATLGQVQESQASGSPDNLPQASWGLPSVQHRSTSFANRKCCHGNEQTDQELGIRGRCPQPFMRNLPGGLSGGLPLYGHTVQLPGLGKGRSAGR